MRYRVEFLGELIGTFLLVLFGCGSVAVSILFQAYDGILPIALAWGIGVSLAIYATRHLSCAHLNPAVTTAMVLTGRMKKSKMPAYLAGQFAGAFLAGLAIYLLFSPSIASFEAASGILRGTPDSAATARMFGEFYLNAEEGVSAMLRGMLGEGFGTFLLVLLIFSLTEGCNLGRPHDNQAPVFIGLSVASIICLIGPLTQAGLNPARDLGPRLAAMLFGWGPAAFPDHTGGFFFVYILAPLAGAVLAGFLFTKVLAPAMDSRKPEDGCGCGKADLQKG